MLKSTRGKLPKGFSYPVGVQLTSKYLEESFRLLGISDIVFEGTKPYNLKLFEKEFRVAELSYWSYFAKTSLENMKWYFTFYQVTSIHNSIIKELLKNEGFEKIKNWIKTKRPDTWYINFHYFTIWFRVSDCTLYFKEKES